MKMDKIDAFVLSCGVLLALLLAGMLTGVWQLVLYPIPVLAAALLLVGSLNSQDKLGPALLPVVVFSVPLLALFVWIGQTVSSEGRLGGLQYSLGVVYYVLWPFTTLCTGLLYAFVYQRWLKRDLKLGENTTDSVHG